MTRLADLALEREYVATLVAGVAVDHIATAERLSPLDCTVVEHGRILQATYELAAAREEISTITVRTALERDKAPPTAIAALDALGDAALASASVGAMAQRLGQLALARRIRERFMLGIQAVEQLHLDAAQEHAREAVSEAPTQRVTVLSAHETCSMALGSVDIVGVPQRVVARSGFPVLDNAIRGFPRSTMATIGGRTGAGKSALALAMAIRQAQGGMRPGIVSCEDADVIWGGRILAHLCDVNPERLFDAQLDSDMVAQSEIGLREAKRLGLHVAYALNRPVEDVLSAIRALVTEHSCNIITVDYLQSIKLGTDAKRAELVSNAAQRIKSECQALHVPLIMCSQLSRPSKDRPFAEPFDTDLKESGDLENMSEIVILLWKSSDDDDAVTLGKVAKVKWSPRRPRFQITRSSYTGAVEGLDPPRKPEYEPEQPRRSKQPPAARWKDEQ